MADHAAGRSAGLDGLRGLAVAAVVAFHVRPGAVPGGFLGVSLFFTLSGYLIVGRLAAERDEAGRIDLRDFWSRRARRLLPASLLTLGAVAVVWRAAGWASRDIGANLVAALANVANWFRIAHDTPYGVDADASPVLHFWSLAIEEQAYLVLPLVAFCCRRRGWLVGALGALLGVSVIATAWSAGDRTVVYYSTLTRLGEIVLGGLMAVALSRRRPPRQVVVTAAGAIALGVLAWAVVACSLDTEALYRGGLLAVGAVSAVAVAAVARSPRLDRVLGWRPLESLGRISYGVYLFHWPILVGLREAGVDGWRLDASTVAATLAAAAASFALLEQRVRLQTWRLRVRWQALLGGAVACAVLAAALSAPASGRGQDFAAAEARLDAHLLAVRSEAAVPPTEHRRIVTTRDPDPPPAVATTTPPATSSPGVVEAPATIQPDTLAPPPARTTPLQLGFFGDSQATMLALGMANHPDPRFRIVAGAPKLGCAIGRGGERRAAHEGLSVAIDDEICNWATDWPPVFGHEAVDVAAVYAGAWDVQDRRGDPLGPDWTHIGDPAFDAWLLDELRGASQVLLDSGVRTVVWFTITADAEAAPVERYDRFNDLLRELDAEQGAEVQVVDLAAWIEATGERDRLLPDHRHLTIDPNGGTAFEVADSYLLDQLAIADGRGR